MRLHPAGPRARSGSSIKRSIKPPNRIASASAVLFLGLFLSGCALLQSPADQARAVAESGGFREMVLPDSRLRGFIRVRPEGRADRLTVYVEGDGASWPARDQPPHDPTPLKPYLLGMAAADPAAAVAYLGRPCQYLDEAALAGCDRALWIRGRFREDAVESLSAAVTRLKALAGASRVNLVGFSGGGTMAALIAARRDDVACLVTMTAPLDTVAWTRAMGVSPLTGSLNPADFTERLRRVPQVHFRGGRDRVVPADTTRGVLSRMPEARVVDRPDFDHECCWSDEWLRLRARTCLDG